MDNVHYQETGFARDARCEAIIEVGEFGFAGRGATYDEARNSLLRRLGLHQRLLERALSDVVLSAPPAVEASAK